jgi:hypothetical protein
MESALKPLFLENLRGILHWTFDSIPLRTIISLVLPQWQVVDAGVAFVRGIRMVSLFLIFSLDLAFNA